MPLRTAIALILTAGLGLVSPTMRAADAADSARLFSLSARGFTGPGANVLIVGFATSNASKSVLLRGIGPTLANYGVSGVLAQAQLQLYNAAGTVIASISSWDPALASVFIRLGDFPLPAGSADAALLPSLPAGLYTAFVQGAGGTSGIALAEIYDADAGSPAGRMVSLSARANSGPGANVLTGGFAIAGSGPETVLLRGIGPALANYGVPGVLARPVLTLFNAAGVPLATNSGWGGGADLAGVFRQVSAVDLPTASADAAMVVTLAPGAYTAQVAGAGGTSGVALVEIYEVPASARPQKKFHPGHYMMLNIASTSAQQRPLITQNVADPNIVGFQICYTWAQLEPGNGDYSGIDATIASDLAYVAQSGKQLVVQLQYKSKNLADFPAYVQNTPGALVQGPDGYYIPNLWDPSVGIQGRYIALLQQIAAKCDAHPNLELVNLAESAVVDAATTLGGTYTAQGWVGALQAVAVAAGAAFPHTTFEEYINHISGDDSLVGAACANAIAAGCVFGGPDIDPSRNNIPAYDYYAQYAATSHLGSAVQPMDYDLSGAFWYDSDHSKTTEHLFSFATSPRLHVSYIFWLNNFSDANWRNAQATIEAHPWPWY
jgi:hypothetical protein